MTSCGILKEGMISIATVLILACVGLLGGRTEKPAFADEKTVLKGVPYVHQRERLD
jgi:hypothetical protein